MFGISYFRLAAYAVIAVVMFGTFLTINGWRKDSNKLEATTKLLDAVNQKLDAEQKCSVGSICALRTVDEANKAAQAVAQAQQQAEQANVDARNARDKAAQDEADKQSAQIKQYQTGLSNIKLHQNTPSCQKWREEIDPCATH